MHSSLLSCSRLFLILLSLFLTGLAQGNEVLRVLAWPGYADKDIVQQFEQRYQVHVEVTTVDNDETLWQRLTANQGRDFDVFAVNTAELQRYIDSGFTLGLDLDRIPNTRKQLPGFRDLAKIPGITRGGRPHAIPYTYAQMGLIYNRKLLREAPDSIQALWDPRYRGQVLVFDGGSHNFSLAALARGRPPFRFEDRDWHPALERLIALRRNALSFYTQPEEVVEMFRDNQVALVFANYGSQQVKALENAGADIGYVIPKEGALAWLDCWVINRQSKQRKLAETWINYTLESPVSKALTLRHGLANTLENTTHGTADGSIIWLEPVEDIKRREKLWSRIRSGDRLERF